MAESALGGLSDTRRQLLLLIKAAGELTVDDLADSLGITKSAVRQHVTGLEQAGLLNHSAERGRPGRPRFKYVLSRAAEQLFPNRYDEVFLDILSLVDERDPGLADRLIQNHFQRRAESLPPEDGGRPLEEQVADLVRVLEEDGHLPVVDQTGPASWLITGGNCPLLRVSERRPALCEAELSFYRRIVPSATVDCSRGFSEDGEVCTHFVEARA